jgi:very-short-patch-repair endonuclease
MRRQKLARARELRQAQTPTEAYAWPLLRNRRCLGYKFRRQQTLYGYIADFYCAELRLAIELDGSVHEDAERRMQDGLRDAALGRCGISVVRIRNQEVSRERLMAVITERQATRSPSPLVGEGDRG